MSDARAHSLANLEKRRPPFERGNTAARKHGAKAIVALQPRAEELASELRPLVAGFTAGDEIAVRLLALSLARIEAGYAWLAKQEDPVVDKRGKPWPVLAVLERAEASAARAIGQLGMTPGARARSIAEHATGRAGAALADHLMREYSGEGS